MNSTSEWEKAKKRLGSTPAKHLSWLLRFTQLDFDSLSAGQLSDLGWEFKAMESLDPIGILYGGVKSVNSSKKSPLMLNEEKGELVSEVPPGLHELQVAQGELSPILRKFLSEHRTNFEFPALRIGVESLNYYFQEDPKAAFAYPCQLTLGLDQQYIWTMKLIFLLGHLGHGVRQCRECQRIFLADRKDQFFCERRCVNRHTQRVFQAKKSQKNKKGKATQKKS